MWGDGLPIVPPTIAKVKEFLKFTDRSADEVVGTYLPDNREGMIWTVAVNGVMAGCRPEYMPILVAMAEAIADPEFRIQDAGSTPGWETTIVLNSPMLRDRLGFNFKEAVRRPGYQANTSIGRFCRLFFRNVPRLIPGLTDKGTFGQMFRAVIPENEEESSRIGWPSLSVQRGFNADDNVVTLFSVSYEGAPIETFGETAEEHLDRIAFWMSRVIDVAPLYTTKKPPSQKRFALLLSPKVASIIAQGGYSLDAMRKYLFEHSKIPAREWDAKMSSFLGPKGTACELVNEGKPWKLPPEYCVSTDPDRLLPLYYSADQLMIILTGDPDRNRSLLMVVNQYQGYPMSKKIRLPENWDALMSEQEK